jgi:hypothetical protein
MPRRATLRASDADREQVAERLRKAAAEGRLLAYELEERLSTALRAKTYGELDAVIADLPGARLVPAARPQLMLRRQPLATVAILVAVTLVTCVLAALVLAGVVAASGAWIFLAFFWFARGGPRHCRGGRRRRHPTAHYGGYRNVAGRW